jgi:hypothetical protein
VSRHPGLLRGDVAQFDRDQLRDPGRFGRHAEQHVGLFHGRPVMGDDDNLSVAGKLLQEHREPVHVGVVERRVNLVEETERRRLHPVEREEQAEREQRFLAVRELVQALGRLAFGLGDD